MGALSLSWLPECTPTTLISAFAAPDTSYISASQLRLIGRGMQSELAFKLSTWFPEAYMPCKQNTFCAYYYRYRHFHPIYGYISTKSAETHKLAQHEKVWNQKWWGRRADVSMLAL